MVDQSGIGAQERIHKELHRRVGDEDRDDQDALQGRAQFLKDKLVDADRQQNVQKGSQQCENHIVHQRVGSHIRKDRL